MNTPIFEHTTCSRCNGSGKHSFNLMHGDRCYGCGGTGYKLTKRGRAASEHLKMLRSRPASEVKVGDLVRFDMYFFACFSTVTNVTVQPNGLISIGAVRAKTGEPIGMIVDPAKMIRFGFTAEEKQAQIELALAYQAKLTKEGKISKRAA